MMKKKIFQNILIIFCSVLFSLFIIEGSISIIDRLIFREDLNKIRLEAAKKLGVPFDTRSLKAVVDDLRSQGIEAYPVLHPFWLLEEDSERKFLPLGGLSKKVMVLDNETGTFETFKTDEHGFHNPQGSWKEGETDILILGDSFAMGACVSSGADIRSQLASYGKKVITLGMNGNEPLLMLAGLREYGKHLKPDIVLWLYYELNDLSELSKSKEISILREYLKDGFTQNLLQRQNEIDQEYLAFYEQLLKEKDRKQSTTAKLSRYLFRFITLSDTRKKMRLFFDSDQAELPLFETILGKAKDLTASWGGKLYFVYLPAYYRYSLHQDDRFALRNQVIEIVKKLDIPLIDFDRTLKEQQDPLALFPFRVHGHYTEAGYGLLAAAIMAELKKDVTVKR